MLISVLVLIGCIVPMHDMSYRGMMGSVKERVRWVGNSIEMIGPPYWTLNWRLPGSEAAPSHTTNPASASLPAMLPSNAICMCMHTQTSGHTCLTASSFNNASVRVN